MLLGTVGLIRVRDCWKLLGYVAAVGNVGSLRVSISLVPASSGVFVL